MSELVRALAVAAVALTAALAAGLLPFVIDGAERRGLLSWMTGVAAGVLLASALLVALPEGFVMLAESAAADAPARLFGLPLPVAAGGAVLVGFLAMLVLESIGLGHDVHEQHHDHASAHGHDHVHHPGAALMIVIGLTLHALADGLALGAALASGSAVLTLSLLLGVMVHKVPAAFSLGVFSLHERRDRRRALLDLLLFAFATPVMVVIGALAFGDARPGLIGLVVLLAAGTFLYVATVDVLPEVHARATGVTALAQVLLGAAALAAALLLAGLL